MQQQKVVWDKILREKGDFLTNIKHFPETDTYVLIHDKPELNIITGIEQVHQFFNQSSISPIAKSLHFQSPIYDALAIGDCILVSNCNMPLRLYKLANNQQPVDWATIFDKKPNSESYLVPLQIAVKQNTILGGGKKFVSSYDLTKFCVKTRLKSMMKRYVSSIELISQFEAVVGQFNGQISFVDLRSQQASTSFKPHVDFVTRIRPVPQTQNQFISLARKDNYSYLWDCRNLSTFIQCFEQSLFDNQRTGLDISKDGKTVFFGSEHGQILARSILTGELLFSHKSSINSCVSSICASSENLLASIGSRTFAFEGEPIEPAHIICLKL